MTDTTDIKALRAESANLMILLHKEEIGVEVTLTSAKFFDDVFRLLEAERQRADNKAKENYRNKCDVDNCMETIANLEAELAAMKGDQVPVAYTDKLSLETLQGNGMACMWKQGQGAEWREQIALFTAPQKPVVLLPVAEDYPIAW